MAHVDRVLALLAPAQPVFDFFGISFDGVEWSMIWDLESFRFVPHVTPFSDFGYVYMAWAWYLCTIFTLWMFMKNRSAFSLKSITVAHNAFLCVWSLVMCVGCSYCVFKIYMAKGFFGPLFCGESRELSGSMMYWCYMYYFSKYYELLDTVLMVLKKKPLTILHCYHHAIMLWAPLMFFYGTMYIQWWAVCVNTLVHVFMYWYYTFASRTYQPWWKKYITTGQLVQFFTVFLFISSYLIYDFQSVDVKYDGFTTTYTYVGRCYSNAGVLAICQFINFTFIGLFANFYLQNYNKKGSAPAKKKQT